MNKLLRIFCVIAVPCIARAAPEHSTPDYQQRNVVLVTFDGVRPQEIFGGLDVDSLDTLPAKDKASDEVANLYKRFGAPTREERRAKIMPFFWGTLMKQHGWIAGDPALGSHVEVTNKFTSSYPGYAEMLTGRAQDDVIIHNVHLRNPHATVLEFVKRELNLPPAKVATFASWDLHNLIVEHSPGTTFVNAGFAPYLNSDQPDSDPLMQQLNALQTEVKPSDDERFDAFTARFAFRYLQQAQPRLLYVMFNETDEDAHEGHYDRVLDALTRYDKFLEKLWTWLQSQPQYRGNTTLIVTTDHGRGDTIKDWTSHGDIPAAKNIWIAIASPDDSRRGELSGGKTLYQKQIAATIAAAFGLDYAEQDPEAGKPIPLHGD